MRPVLAAIAVACLAASPALADAMDDSLAPYRWENRLLILLAGDPADPKLVEQRAILAENPEGLRERDLIVLEGIGDTPLGLRGGPITPRALRDALGETASGFAALLIGKDGGVKLRKNDPVALDTTLYPLIDAMPMRRREMQERSAQ